MGKPKVRDQRSTNVLILRARQGCGSQAVMWNVGNAGVPEYASKPVVWLRQRLVSNSAPEHRNSEKGAW